MNDNKPITLTVSISPELLNPFLQEITKIFQNNLKETKPEVYYLSVKEAAKLANRSVDTIRRHINEGRLLASKKDGKSYQISNNNFENYING